jgi:hypothetical protein
MLFGESSPVAGRFHFSSDYQKPIVPMHEFDPKTRLSRPIQVVMKFPLSCLQL